MERPKMDAEWKQRARIYGQALAGLSKDAAFQERHARAVDALDRLMNEDTEENGATFWSAMRRLETVAIEASAPLAALQPSLFRLLLIDVTETCFIRSGDPRAATVRDELRFDMQSFDALPALTKLREALGIPRPRGRPAGTSGVLAGLDPDQTKKRVLAAVAERRKHGRAVTKANVADDLDMTEQSLRDCLQHYSIKWKDLKRADKK